VEHRHDVGVTAELQQEMGSRRIARPVHSRGRLLLSAEVR